MRRKSFYLICVMLGALCFGGCSSEVEKGVGQASKPVVGKPCVMRLIRPYSRITNFEPIVVTTDTLHDKRRVEMLGWEPDSVRKVQHDGSKLVYIPHQISMDTDTIMWYWGEECKLLEKKTFEVDRKRYTVLKYRQFAGLHMKMNLFFCKEFGLLSIYNFDPNSYNVFEYEDKNSRALMALLFLDRSGFFDEGWAGW
ncbi:hypothetical protein FUAX_10100 [Fulvitalea axinellae]|uniref:Lipoprotein n=1 Tax=Fulvitalea axinellae TaxID=1182444 RepID=A0AAU9CF73_9BACT|nr:hypothetical protein FUAX_10100 [Fulvitalea axinellae]